MAVIDLDTGALVEDDTAAPQDTAQPQSNEVINLDTGAVEEVDPIPQLSDSPVAGQPASALTGLTPEEAAELPEIGVLENSLGVSGEKSKAFKLALGSLVSSEPAQQIEIIQSVLPDAKINTFASGETVVDYQGQKFILNKPGLSAADVTRFAGQFMAFLPLGKLAQVGRAGVVKSGSIKALEPLAKSAVNQRLGQVATVASGSAAISAGLDISAQELAGEESTQGISKERAALSAIFGGGGELIGPVFRSVVRKFRGTPNDLKFIDLDAVKELKKAEEITGIKLFEPQATQARADSAYMKILQDLPETQQQMAVALNQQNQEAGAAVTNYLATIADKKAIVTAPKQVRDLAVGAIDEMKAARTDLVNQGYQESFAVGTKVDIKPLIDSIDASLAKTPSKGTNPIRAALENAKNLIKSDASEQAFTEGLSGKPRFVEGGLNDLKILHDAKILIGEETGKLLAKGNTSAARELTLLNQKLTASLEDASPLYDQVKSIYRDASGPINDLEKSLVGKVSGVKDENLKKVLSSIFDASESNPANLKQAKSIIESQDPDAWNQLLRAHLESNLGKVSTRNVEGVQNIPNAFLGALFGKNEVQRRMILDSMNPEQQGSARWLEMALKAASRGRGVGSDTAAKQEAIKTFKGEAGSLSAYLNPLAWPKQLSEAMSQAKFERRASAFVEALTNGEWSAEMAKLKSMSPSNSAAGRSLVQLLTRIETGGLDDERQPVQQPDIILPEEMQ